MERVIAYIDGFNLYFGLKSKNWKKYLWLNLKALAERLLQPNQNLVFTKYFTAKVIKSPGKERRQSSFIKALETLTDFKIFYGKYQLNPRSCIKCNFIDYVPNEKMTDVNIAVEMLSDAFQDEFDTALLISADSDLAPVVRAIKKLFPNKRIVAAFPPVRHSFELTDCVDAYLRIGRSVIAQSTFPEKVKRPDGYILKCPKEWK